MKLKQVKFNKYVLKIHFSLLGLHTIIKLLLGFETH